MSIFALFLLGIVVFAVYLFQLSDVQTRIAKTFTERLSSTYQSDISIRKASIDLLGNLRFYDFLIRDHQNDTLFYGKELKTELESIDNFLNRNYSLNTVEIEGPYLKEKTYDGEEETSLQLFVEKVKSASSNPKKAFTLQLDGLNISNGLYRIQGSDKTMNYPLEAEFENIRYLGETFSFSLNKLSGKVPLLDQINALSTNFRKKGDSIQLSKLNLVGTQLNAKGALELFLPSDQGKWDLESAVLDAHFDSLITRSSSLPFLPQSFPEAPLKLENLKLSGSTTDLHGKVNLHWGDKIKATTAFSGNFKSKSKYRFETENLEVFWTQKGLNTLLTSSQNESLPMVLPKNGNLKAAIQIAPKEYTTAFHLFSNMGQIVGNVSAKKLENQNHWNSSVHMDWIDMQLYSSSGKVELDNVNASVDFEIQKEDTKPFEITWQADVKNVLWKDRRLNAISSSGEKREKDLQGELVINDPSLQAVLSLNLNASKSSFLGGEIKALDLSQWTIASKQANAILSAKFNSSFQENKGKLEFRNFNIVNQKGSISFEPISFQYLTNDKNKKIVSNDNNAIGFSLEGIFDINDFSSVTLSAFEEVVFFRPHLSRKKKTAFSFSILLKQQLIEALYPDLSTPDDLHSEGFISSVKGNSYFEMELPLLKVKNYSIEGLKLETSKNNPFFNTYLTAKAMKTDGFSIRNVNLLSFTADEELLVRLEGIYGKLDQTFELNFNHKYQKNLSRFLLKNAMITSPEGSWQFNDQEEAEITYDFAQQSIQVQNIFAVNGNQQLELSGFFKSKKAFEIDFKAKAVQVEHLLPPNDKFSISGKFSANGVLGLNSKNTSNALKMSLEDMIVNDVPMGELALAVESNPNLNAFRLSGAIKKEAQPALEYLGSIFIKEDVLNTDINFELNRFSLSFLSRLGRDKITNVEGDLTGKLNLWGNLNDLHLDGTTQMTGGSFYLPVTNVTYKINDNSNIAFSNSSIQMRNILVFDEIMQTQGRLSSELKHINFKGWTLDLGLSSNRFLVYNKKEDPEELFYGQGFLNGNVLLEGPTKSLTLNVNGTTAEGTTLTIPWNEDKGLSDTNYIDFLPKNRLNVDPITAEISDIDENFRGFEMNFDLDVNQNAEIEIVVDQSSGSTLSGRGAGNILIESNIDGKFNIWGDFITTTGIYKFKNLGLIDKKFKVLQGGTIVWEGDPVEAQMNLEAVYEVPGGANPALLVDNPNFNKKIPTDVKIQLQGNLLKPDDPLFEIEFPNASTVVKSEINYRLADQQRRQLQALSLLSQGVFISDVSLSVQGIANNLYEKASDVFSTLLGSGSGKLDVGVNYLKGEETPFLDARTEDRIGVTLTTQISDKILINGKIGVPVGGVEETLIVGDVQIDFILNEDGTLKAKVFNKENEFRYLGDEIGYTQGVGLSYQVDFDNFRELIQKITRQANTPKNTNTEPIKPAAVEILTKKY